MTHYYYITVNKKRSHLEFNYKTFPLNTHHSAILHRKPTKLYQEIPTIAPCRHLIVLLYKMVK